jgi:hypothetical protein
MRKDPHPPTAPATAPTGRSTPGQARKLGIVEGSRVHLVGAPPGWSLADPPPGVVVARLKAPLAPGGAPERGPADLVIVFVRDSHELAAALASAPEPATLPAAVWICWPRRAGGHESDLTDRDVRRAGLALGLVDNKVAAVDTDWSGLRFAHRRGRR